MTSDALSIVCKTAASAIYIAPHSYAAVSAAAAVASVLAAVTVPIIEADSHSSSPQCHHSTQYLRSAIIPLNLSAVPT